MVFFDGLNWDLKNTSRFFYTFDCNLAAIKHLFSKLSSQSFVQVRKKQKQKLKQRWRSWDPNTELSYGHPIPRVLAVLILSGQMSLPYRVSSCPILAKSRDNATGSGQCRDWKILVWGGLVKYKQMVSLERGLVSCCCNHGLAGYIFRLSLCGLLVD